MSRYKKAYYDCFAEWVKIQPKNKDNRILYMLLPWGYETGKNSLMYEGYYLGNDIYETVDKKQINLRNFPYDIKLTYQTPQVNYEAAEKSLIMEEII